MKRRGFFLLAIFMLIASMMAACSSNNGTAKGNGENEELGAKYRDMVHSVISNRASKYNASTRYMMLVDFSIPSNNDRFFVWDTEKDSIVYATWCAHGCGGGSTAERPVFSNEFGSNCSSLGLYTVDRGTGVSSRWGYTYHAVDGRDATNSNAKARQVVIHYWHSVTSDWQAKISEPMRCDYRSAGCFTLPEPSFWKIDKLIKSESKRILLYAIDGI